MSFSNPLIILAFLFAVLGLIFLLVTVAVIRKRKIFASAGNFVLALLMLSLSALFGTISVAIQGYQALTKEVLAATVDVEPTGKQKFVATFSLPNGSRKVFSLAGDEIYVDAHILKWKPLGNIFGLHTSYELDRVSGRYSNVNEETSKPHTVYPLSEDKPVDMFDLRQKFALLNPLLDAEYGSATFIKFRNVQKFRIMVSTTGLLIRQNDK